MRQAKALFIVLLIAVPLSGFAEDITLVKRAKKVESLQSSTYRVQEGDTLWKIFLEHFSARTEDMPYLYKEFRELNPRVKDLNHILAGHKLIIPRMPDQAGEMSVKAASADVYVMKRGQHLAMVLRQVYGLPDKLIFNEYLNLIKELNPDIEDLNRVEPGQKIKMPKVEEVVDAVEKAEKKHAASRKKEQKKPEQIKKEPALPEKEAVSVAAVPPRQEKTEIKEAEKQEDKSEEVQPEKPRDVSEQKPEVTSGGQEAEKARIEDEKRQRATRLVRNTLMPALTEMGGNRKDQGTYFMPMEGGSSLSIDASEIPVMELDTGRRIILDVNNKISSEIRDLLEKTFPDCKIVSGPVDDLEDVMDRVLSVSGYFSINKDAGPLLVGEEEKIRFFGKWIVYKDFSRHNVFVVNVLSDEDERTPDVIQDYASRFGIDLIELGGREEVSEQAGQDLVKNLGHSYRKLFDELGVAYETDRVLDLVALKALKITYKAPLLVKSVIFTPDLPDETMADLLKQKGYQVIHTKDAPLREVLSAVEIAPEGPPISVVVAQSRTELELPALKVGDNIILERGIDRDIANYLVSQGSRILAW